MQVIPARRLEALVVEHAGGCRQRIYPPLVTLGLFTEQVLCADGACQDAVGRALSHCTALGLSPCSLNTGPYCRARQRLPLALLETLAKDVANSQGDERPGRLSWRGHEVKLVDGTTVSMPDTPENQAAFPPNRAQAPGLGFPLARVLGVISLTHGSVLDWSVCACEGAGTAEPMQLRRLLPGFAPGDLMIADRNFASYFMAAELMQRGIAFVIREPLQRKNDPERALRLGERDALHTWRRPARPDWMEPAVHARMPAQITVREVWDRDWRLSTSLTDADDVPAAEIAWLYQQRWQIELDFRAIKSVMKMDILRGKTPDMARKEIAAHLLAYNLVRAVMNSAAQSRSQWPRQLSFAGARRAVARFQETLRHHPGLHFKQAWEQLLRSVAALNLPQRPGRIEPRAVKRRPKPHPCLHLPRTAARQQLLQQRQIEKTKLNMRLR